jgi:hypothetical protein
MSDAIEHYRDLLRQLLVERAIAGGALPDEDESQRVADLDRLWWTLSSEEQDRVEREIKDESPPTAPVELGQQDLRVEPGQRSAPRKAAA